MKLSEIIDKIKINKFAEASGLFGVYNLLYDSEESFIVSGLCTALLIASAGVVKLQNDRYDRLLNKIKENGYDKRACSLYMDSPCGRSLVKTVLKRTKNFGHYQKLKEWHSLIALLD